MRAQRAKILDGLGRRGWRAAPVEDYELEWWADEMWLLESTVSPVGSRAYLTFLVDPAIPHSRTRRKGEAVWAVMASAAKPAGYISTEDSFTLSLGRGWEDGLDGLFELLAALRDREPGR